MKPYYDDGQGRVIYHGDCLEIIATLDKVDLVLTDPPYGISRVWKGGFGNGWSKARSEALLRNQWDSTTPSYETIDKVIGLGENACVWGGNYFALPPSRGWLIWTKPERGFSLSEAELAWTNRDAVIRVFDGVRSDPGRKHPTQKPVALMAWCLRHFKNARTILDPFMGSGTTLVAAKQLGRSCIGIEIEERYCEIAARRLEEAKTMFDQAGSTQLTFGADE